LRLETLVIAYKDDLDWCLVSWQWICPVSWIYETVQK